MKGRLHKNYSPMTEIENLEELAKKMIKRIGFEIPRDCNDCQEKAEKLRKIHENRKPYDETKLTLTLTRDILGRDYWHIHTLEVSEFC